MLYHILQQRLVTHTVATPTFISKQFSWQLTQAVCALKTSQVVQELLILCSAWSHDVHYLFGESCAQFRAAGITCGGKPDVTSPAVHIHRRGPFSHACLGLRILPGNPGMMKSMSSHSQNHISKYHSSGLRSRGKFGKELIEGCVAPIRLPCLCKISPLGDFCSTWEP